MNTTVPLPYCGAPPVPGHVIWNTDPVLAAVLFAGAALYLVGIRHAQRARWQPVCFWSGYAVLTLALVSPICNLSVALFSARIAQHVLLVAVAAPLLILGRAEHMFAVVPPAWRNWARDGGSGLYARAGGLAGPVATFTVVLWLWHLPAFYDATFRSTFVYWTMHVTMVGAALMFWWTAFRGSDSFAAMLAALFANILQMSLLGAILTFAKRPLFTVHAATTWPWGLSQLQDQQLGGLIMWIIGGTLLVVYASVMFANHLRRLDAADAR